MTSRVANIKADSAVNLCCWIFKGKTTFKPFRLELSSGRSSADNLDNLITSLLHSITVWSTLESRIALKPSVRFLVFPTNNNLQTATHCKLEIARATCPLDWVMMGKQTHVGLATFFAKLMGANS